MRIVLQRVRKASVEVQGRTAGKIGKGICLLVGVEKGDSEEVARYLAKKVVELRIFPDSEGKMNLSLREVKGDVLAVSQFTLAGSIQKGRRPSFDRAEAPDRASGLFDYLVEQIQQQGVHVETGIFQAMMDVNLVNDGPVTFILERRQDAGREG